MFSLSDDEMRNGVPVPGRMPRAAPVSVPSFNLDSAPNDRMYNVARERVGSDASTLTAGSGYSSGLSTSAPRRDSMLYPPSSSAPSTESFAKSLPSNAYFGARTAPRSDPWAVPTKGSSKSGSLDVPSSSNSNKSSPVGSPSMRDVSMKMYSWVDGGKWDHHGVEH